MKKMMKKSIACVLCFALLCSNISVFAYSNETTQNQDEVISAEVLSEIADRKEEIYNAVYEQLEAQDALDLLDVYEAILYPMIETQTLEKYGYSSTSTARGQLYCLANYGGVATFTYNDFGLFDTDVVMSCFNREDTLYNILNSGTFYVGDFIKVALGFLPVVGSIFTDLFYLQSVVGSTAKKSINNANGYSMVMNTYRRNGDFASVVVGWTDYPYIMLPEGAYDWHFEVFPEHDPWA